MGPSDRRPFRAGGIMVASREARPDTRRCERSGSRDIWPRPLRALSTASTRAEEAESEWYQWLELKKPVDWEPHTSIAVQARPVEPSRAESLGRRAPPNPAAVRRMAGSW